MKASQELGNGYGPVFFAVRNVKVVNTLYKILHWFARYNRQLDVQASANDFFKDQAHFL